MARRLVEKMYARLSMVSSPRMPVKRPISATLVFYSANQTVNQRLPGRRRLVGDLVTGLDHLSCRRHSRLGIVVNRAQRLAPGHTLAHLLTQHEADRRVYAVFLPFPSPAQHHAGDSNLLALDRGHKALARA